MRIEPRGDERVAGERVSPREPLKTLGLPHGKEAHPMRALKQQDLRAIARLEARDHVHAAGGLGIPKVERHHCLLQRWVAVAQVLGTAANARRTQDLCAVPWALWTATQ